MATAKVAFTSASNRKMEAEDQRENYLYSAGDKAHNQVYHHELVRRVALGLKPVARIVLVKGEDGTALTEPYPNVGFVCVSHPAGVRLMLVYVPGTSLAQYWDVEAVQAQYAQAQALFVPPKEPIYDMLEALAEEDMDEPLIGLLYGYPVEETLATM